MIGKAGREGESHPSSGYDRSGDLSLSSGEIEAKI